MAKQIAEFCWSEIRKVENENLSMKDPQFLRAVHCLRFLKEAFRARRECISSFQSTLAAFILNQITGGENLLVKKLAVEAVGLLTPEDIDPALVMTLDMNNQWLDEVVLKSCHYLPTLSKELSKKLRFFIDGMDVVTFLKKRKELIFSLNLSNVFRDLKTYCNWRTADSYSFIIGTILYCAIEPLAILPIVLYFTFLSQFFPFPVRRRESMFVVFANRSAIFSLATIPAFVVSIIRMGGLSYNALQIYDPLSFMPLSFMPLSFMNIRIFLFAFLLLIPWYLIIFNCSEVIVWL